MSSHILLLHVEIAKKEEHKVLPTVWYFNDIKNKDLLVFFAGSSHESDAIFKEKIKFTLEKVRET